MQILLRVILGYTNTRISYLDRLQGQLPQGPFLLCQWEYPSLHREILRKQIRSQTLLGGKMTRIILQSLLFLFLTVGLLPVTSDQSNAQNGDALDALNKALDKANSPSPSPAPADTPSKVPADAPASQLDQPPPKEKAKPVAKSQPKKAAPARTLQGAGSILND